MSRNYQQSDAFRRDEERDAVELTKDDRARAAAAGVTETTHFPTIRQWTVERTLQALVEEIDLLAGGQREVDADRLSELHRNGRNAIASLGYGLGTIRDITASVEAVDDKLHAAIDEIEDNDDRNNAEELLDMLKKEVGDLRVIVQPFHDQDAMDRVGASFARKGSA